MSAESDRPVRINLSLEADVVGKAIKQTLRVLSSGDVVEFVTSSEEADLIVFDDVRNIEKGFSREKSYAYLAGMRSGERYPAFPTNVSVVPVTQAVATLIKLVSDLSKKLQPIAVHEDVQREEAVPLREDAKRILVIDDTPKHIASAKKTLAGHRVITATNYEDAMDILEREKFDVVLTDLHLPMSSRTLSPHAFKLGELVPYGILLMIEAARQGAKHVAVVTDLSHHDDPFSAAFDHYSRFPVQIEGAKVLMLHARVNDEGKDWGAALNRLLG